MSMVKLDIKKLNAAYAGKTQSKPKPKKP
jgi:hypothetical protein